MTRRERLERKVERRREWADKRRDGAAAVARESERYRGDNAFNTQPGHIPERARLIAREDRAFESLKVADHHDSKAAGLAAQLDHAIFSDDTDATERLRERIAELEAKRERMKKENAAYRKAPGADPAAKLAAMVRAGTMTEADAVAVSRFWAVCPYHAGKPHPAYELSNLGANISRFRKRLVDVEAQQGRAALAEAAPSGVLVEHVGEYARVTFPEKPAGSVLDALRAAGFRWGAGSWVGLWSSLPTEVTNDTNEGGDT